MKIEYYDKRSRKRSFLTSYGLRQRNSELVGAYTDYQMRQKDKKEPEKGSKLQFLEVYEKLGYEAAKEQINARFGREVFTDEILEKWIEEARKKENKNRDDDDAR